MSFDLNGFLDRCRDEVEQYLDRSLPSADTFPHPLFEAARYSLFAGGKRIRPGFVFAAADACGGPRESALPFAAAVEMVHSYSLIHDDLPAMDDDDLRRGKPTNHILYGEGMAILAGDGLLTDAFALLSSEQVLAVCDAHTVVQAIHLLAHSAGTGGMVAGQALDLVSEGKSVDLPTLEFLHTHKTGALIRASVLLGGLAVNADPQAMGQLERYAQRIGLAFQIADDVLDVESTTEALGKPVGSDQGLSKATYPALLGISESKRRARELMDQALAAVQGFGERGAGLAALARFVVERRN